MNTYNTFHKRNLGIEQYKESGMLLTYIPRKQGCIKKLIEGCLISGYAVNAHVCYIYIRGEYFNEGKKLQEAIDQAYKKTFWGKMLVTQVGILIFTFITVLVRIYAVKKQHYLKV